MATKRRLQVFISSTYTDLKEERQAAVAAVLKAGHIPAGMELFTAGDESQMTIIKRWIDESDVYVLILGGRYGSIEKGTGLSYTELEFDYAVEKNKPLFAVVMNDKAIEEKTRAQGRAALELDNPALLKNFRTKALSNISSFFDDLKDIKLAVHESLADFASNRDLKGWIAAGEVQDTAPLYDQIERLSTENSALREKVAQLERLPTAQTKKSSNFNDLYDVLRGTEIQLPDNLRQKDTPKKLDLFSIFWSMHEQFVTGIINSTGMGNAEKFLYFTAGPKLVLHGLVEIEKSAGSEPRRMVTTRAGTEFLAEYERSKIAKAKAEKRAQPVSDEAPLEPTAVPASAAANKTPRKRVPLKKSA